MDQSSRATRCRTGHGCQRGRSVTAQPPKDRHPGPPSSNGPRRNRWGRRPDTYAALDLGTNNCRLLIARPSRRGFQIVDAFSRIIRLGEGVSVTGELADHAMARTEDALRVCAAKLARNNVQRARLVATEACRIARNAPEFLADIHRKLGLDIEILSREHEAELAVCGCASLIDPASDLVLVFDIGGGSSELIWLDLSRNTRRAADDRIGRIEARDSIAAWTSLPVGVVTLAEKFGGQYVDAQLFEAMVAHVADLIAPFEAEHGYLARLATARAHLLGTSGTVTTVAGISMQLPRYDRSKVDGCWLAATQARAVTHDLIQMSYEQRVAQACIGRDRADLVLAGCAILEAILRLWPLERLRVADRGLREGILATLMAEDGHDRPSRHQA
jgi:exopolyphosphatase / guanosine-5'-triphosphate,3'-diphosphate pyrophosphatase